MLSKCCQSSQSQKLWGGAPESTLSPSPPLPPPLLPTPLLIHSLEKRVTLMFTWQYKLNFTCFDFADCPPTQVFNQCGSACTPTCSRPVIPCTLQCVARCECPRGTLLNQRTKRCVPLSKCPGNNIYIPKMIYKLEENLCFMQEIRDSISSVAFLPAKSLILN